MADLSSTISGAEEARRVAWERLRASRRFDELVEQVRSLPDDGEAFRPSEFMRPPALADLLPTESTGPVVVVNASRWRCDALLLSPGGVEPLALPMTAAAAIENANRYLRAMSRYTKTGDGVALAMATQTVMRWTWDAIAGPVLDHLGIPATGEDAPPRIWWCPTGPLSLLPIHAAGHPGDTVRSALDRVVSSYTPTLRALAHARSRRPTDREESALIIAIEKTAPVQGSGDLSVRDLPGASREQQAVKRSLGRIPVTVLTDADATKEAFLSSLPTHAWVHIACHGVQDPWEPAAGGLVPYDWNGSGLVTVDDFAGISSEGGRLAFLSACHSAVGDVVNLDEAISLAAAMLASGWQHAIGTLWTVRDGDAAAVAEHCYSMMIRGDRLDPSESARALHSAVHALRNRVPDDPARWARFAHFGP